MKAIRTLVFLSICLSLVAAEQKTITLTLSLCQDDNEDKCDFGLVMGEGKTLNEMIKDKNAVSALVIGANCKGSVTTTTKDGEFTLQSDSDDDDNSRYMVKSPCSNNHFDFIPKVIKKVDSSTPRKKCHHYEGPICQEKPSSDTTKP